MFDVAIIGGGPGGYVAAIRAAQLGGKVLLAEREQLGGVCLNQGCIPTKTLLRSAEKWRELGECAAYGLQATEIGFDLAAMQLRKRQVVEQMRGGVEQLLKSNGVEVVRGTATLRGPQELEVTLADGVRCSYAAKSMIVASGSRVWRPPIAGIELPAVLDSSAALLLENVPSSLAVIGGGAVGVEFAALWRSLGAEVTLIEMLPGILPGVDEDVAKRLAMVLRKTGIRLLTGTKVKSLQDSAGHVALQLENAKGDAKLIAERVLIAAGRRPNVEGLGLEAAGVKYSAAGVAVNDSLATNIPTIYAIGDVTGRQMLAHVASAAALVAAENALGGKRRMDFTAVPACVFTVPEVASVGLTEQAAAELGIQYKTSRFNFAGNGKALAMGETDGLVKMIAAADGKLLGMHILGAHASDLIMEGALALRHGLSAADIAAAIHPHPTLSEVVLEAAHGVDGPMIHQLKLARRDENR